MRVGIGYDSHSFGDAHPLTLGEDVVAHAITDALLGAACLGTIDTLFPDPESDDHDADSIEMLAETVRRLESQNYQIVNVDVTVVCERPKVAPVARAIAERLAPILHTRPSDVSIKGTSNAGMGWIGRGEGVGVMAVASIAQIEDIDALHASIRSGGG